MESKAFVKMKYRIDKIPMSEQVVFKFQDLSQFANVFASSVGLPERLTPDFVLRYIILMYSPGSPGIEAYPMLSKRKGWALKELGVEPNQQGEFPTEYNELLLNKNANCRAKIVLFLRLQQPEDWAIMMRTEEMLYDILALDMPEDPVDQKSHISNIESLRKQLSDARDRFMQGEISKALEHEITKFLAQDNLGIRPEEYMMFAPPSVPPHKAKSNQMFPEVGN
jgi:hypothetical protein